MNIQLSYLYRDGANYKQYGAAIFSNDTGLTVQDVNATIRKQLISSEWFYANEWGLADLHLHTWDNDIDHTWHEYDEITETVDAATNGTLTDFFRLIVVSDAEHKL